MGIIRKSVGFLMGAAMGFLLAACATSFPYHYYGLDLKEQKLLGPAAADDLSLKVCDATEGNASPCIAMLSDAFLQMKKSYIDLQNQLIACQKGKN